jgi:nitrogen PTS system EIIA component
MQVDVKTASKLLMVSEKTIYRWIKSGDLPAYRINDIYRFNRAELLEWATAKRINVSPDIFREAEEEGEPLPGLEEAIRTGGIHYRVSGADKKSVLFSVVGLMQLPPEVDKNHLLEVILARETLGSTGVGEGIAIPHVRNPIVLHLPNPSITLCFLESPIPFDSVDGKPVHTLFTLVSPTVRSHLHLLSRLTFALRGSPFREAIGNQASREEILAAARAADTGTGGRPS